MSDLQVAVGVNRYMWCRCCGLGPPTTLGCDARLRVWCRRKEGGLPEPNRKEQYNVDRYRRVDVMCSKKARNKAVC